MKHKNIYWNARSKKWRVRISVNNNNEHIGCFNTLEEAETARDNFKASLGINNYVYSEKCLDGHRMIYRKKDIERILKLRS